jgi:hypothetical protein
MIQIFVLIPIGIAVPAALACMSKGTLLTVTIIAASLGAAAPALADALPTTGTAVFIGCMSGLMTAPLIPLNAMAPEVAHSPEDVGSAVGAMVAAKSLMGIIGGPLEAAGFTALDKLGLAWLTYIVFALICLLALVPAALFNYSFVPRASSFTPPRQMSRFCVLFAGIFRSSMRAIFYSPLQFFFALLSFITLIVLACLSVGLVPVACIGFPIFAVLFKVIDTFAIVDLALTRCMDASTARRPSRTVPSWWSSQEGHLVWLCANVKDSRTWLSFLYFVVVKLPLEMLTFMFLFGWIGNSLVLVCTPGLRFVSTRRMCLEESLRMVFGMADCDGYEIDTPLKSLLPVIPGCVLLLLGAFMARGLAQFSIRHARWFHGASEIQPDASIPLSSDQARTFSAPFSYWDSYIAQPSRWDAQPATFGNIAQPQPRLQERPIATF